MALGRGYCTLAILLTLVDLQPSGSIRISSSASQEGKRLDLTCTLWHKKEETEGSVLFLCKDRSWNCSPETSLEQLRLKRDPRMDGEGEAASQLVFTIHEATPLDSGIYQCCARSQRLGVHLQGHFFSVLVTETGDYIVTGLKREHHPKVSQSEGPHSSSSPQAMVWGILITSLVAFEAL